MNEPHIQPSNRPDVLTESDPRGFSTRAVHAGHKLEEGDPLGGSIIQTSSYALVNDGQRIIESRDADYGRVGNPTFTVLEKTFASLHGAQFATVYGSGIAAISAVAMTLKSGDLVIAEENTYGCTIRLFREVLQKFGVRVEYIDLANSENFSSIKEKKPTLVLIESPTNPLLKILDIGAIAQACNDSGTTLAVDNSFASSYCQKPLRLGATIVIESLTKYSNGHSTAMGGAACTNSPEWAERLDFQRKAIGLQPGPLDTFLTTQGIKTLELRMERHGENALAVAQHLERLPIVNRVRYPLLPSHPQFELAKMQMRNGSGILNVDFNISPEQAIRLLDYLRPEFQIAHSIGSVESQVSMPALMSHASVPREQRLRAGITDGLVRFSVGIENKEDLIAAIDRALEMITH